MTKTYKVIKDRHDRDALEISETLTKVTELHKQGIIDEIARLQVLLDKFN